MIPPSQLLSVLVPVGARGLPSPEGRVPQGPEALRGAAAASRPAGVRETVTGSTADLAHVYFCSIVLFCCVRKRIIYSFPCSIASFNLFYFSLPQLFSVSLLYLSNHESPGNVKNFFQAENNKARVIPIFSLNIPVSSRPSLT